MVNGGGTDHQDDDEQDALGVAPQSLPSKVSHGPVLLTPRQKAQGTGGPGDLDSTRTQVIRIPLNIPRGPAWIWNQISAGTRTCVDAMLRLTVFKPSACISPLFPSALASIWAKATRLYTALTRSHTSKLEQTLSMPGKQRGRVELSLQNKCMSAGFTTTTKKS